LLATIDSISLWLISNPIQLLILTVIALQLCSPRRRAWPAENAGEAIG
jgi:hypothetical protein